MTTLDTQIEPGRHRVPASRAPAAALATRSLAPIPDLSIRQGLLRYRNDRVGILAELGDRRTDIAQTSLGPLRLVYITEASLAHSVLVEHNDAFRKGPAVTRYSTALLGDGLFTSMGADHRRQRKVLAPRFTPRQIAKYVHIMRELTEDMLARWRTETPADFDREIVALTMAIAARTMFGRDVAAEDVDVLFDGLMDANRWFINQSISLLPLPLSIPSPGNRRMQKALHAMDRVVYRLLAQHRQHGTGDDVLGALLAARDDDGVGMSDALLRDQVMTFFVAGHETISSTLSWTYRLLRDHSHVAERIAVEAEAVLGAQDERPQRGAPATGASGPGAMPDLRKLVYTRAVLQEAMRLRPAAYMIGRQALTDVQVGEHCISKGSYVVVNLLGMHRRADYFPDPLAFRPERFTTTPTWPRSGFIPFGAGARVCIGNHFALMEGALVLALICRAMTFGPRSLADASGLQSDDYEAEPLLTMRPRNRVPFALSWRTA